MNDCRPIRGSIHPSRPPSSFNRNSHDQSLTCILSAEYDSPRSALLGCQKALLRADPIKDTRYYKAKCFVEPKAERFVFAIKSKNPFLP